MFEYIIVLMFLFFTISVMIGVVSFNRSYQTSSKEQEIARLKKIDEEQLKLFRKEELRELTEKYSGPVKKMAEYRRHLERLSDKSESGIHSHRLEKVLDSFDDWEAHVKRLVERLVTYELDESWKRERPLLLKKILETQFQLDLEKDPRLKKEIKESLSSLLKQQDQIENLRFLIEKFRLDLEEFVSGIGTVYSQLLTLEAMDVRGSRAKRLSHEISTTTRLRSRLI